MIDRKKSEKLLEAPTPHELLPIGNPPPLMLTGKRQPWRLIGGIIAGLLVILVLVASGTYVWYQLQLRPVSHSDQQVRVTIQSGMGPKDIAALLKQDRLIRSTAGFDWYTRLHGNGGKLQAGVYSLSPRMSLPEIVGDMVKGKTDTFMITFLPGATLEEDKAVLKKAGYTSEEIADGVQKASQYETALFGGKPTSADLEGYIYGETYQFSADATVQDILERTFNEFMQVVTQHNLAQAFSKQGLTLYQGITLASIIQREMSSHTSDMPQVAQVFYLRLKNGTPLGSDVTFEYAAKKLGVPATPDLKSPYNTRINAGLPPGPIATPGLDALLAAAHPASGDYLYFLSGDDGKTYFAKTYAEHEANIKNHCQEKCAQ